MEGRLTVGPGSFPEEVDAETEEETEEEEEEMDEDEEATPGEGKRGLRGAADVGGGHVADIRRAGLARYEAGAADAMAAPKRQKTNGGASRPAPVDFDTLPPLPPATGNDGWDIPFGNDTWIRDKDFLQKLGSECDANRKGWASLNYTGPALRAVCSGLHDMCPCASPLCAGIARTRGPGSATTGGGKCFCLIRFLLDPEHMEPLHSRAKALKCIEYGLQVRKLAKTFLETYESKRSLHSWGETFLDTSGIARRLQLIAEQGKPLRHRRRTVGTRRVICDNRDEQHAELFVDRV